MIFKRRLSSALLVLLCGAFAVSETTSDDFKFDSDDLQVRISRSIWINCSDDKAQT